MGQACALSLLAFSGASQFALIGAVAGGGNLLAAAVGAVLLGGRNGAVRPAARRHPARTRLAAAPHRAPRHRRDDGGRHRAGRPRAARAGFWATAITLFSMWNLTTLLGAARRLASWATPQTYGLDVVGPAAFLALLWPRLTAGAAERRVAVLAAAHRDRHDPAAAARRTDHARGRRRPGRAVPAPRRRAGRRAGPRTGPDRPREDS